MAPLSCTTSMLALSRLWRILPRLTNMRDSSPMLSNSYELSHHKPRPSTAKSTNSFLSWGRFSDGKVYMRLSLKSNRKDGNSSNSVICVMLHSYFFKCLLTSSTEWCSSFNCSTSPIKLFLTKFNKWKVIATLSNASLGWYFIWGLLRKHGRREAMQKKKHMY